MAKIINKLKNNVLIVAQDITIINEIKDSLSNEDFNYLIANSTKEAMEIITYQVPQIIISEINLPHFDSIDFCEKIRKGIKTKLIPFIFISPSDKIDEKIKALNIGADHYLILPINKEELHALVKTRINRFNEFYLVSITDELTKLYNRREFLKKINEELSRKDKNNISLCIIDLDHFKQVNDIYGHQMGDIVLMNFADLLMSHTSDKFFPARFGGEEFIILMPDTTSEKAKLIIDEIREKLNKIDFEVSKEKNKIFHVSFSAGIAEYPTMAQNLSELLSRSDQALYSAKNNGRGRTYIFNPIMAHNDRFWEYLKGKKNFYINENYYDSATELPYLPFILEQIANLDFEVRSIGTLVIKLNTLFSINHDRGLKNLEYDIENIKYSIIKSCNYHFPSDMYIGLTSFFKNEFIVLFPSIVDFSINVNKFNDICDEIINDISKRISNYALEVSYASDVIYFDLKDPKKIIEPIEYIIGKTSPVNSKRKLFELQMKSFFYSIKRNDMSLASLLDIKNFINSETNTPIYQYFTIKNSILNTDILDLILNKYITDENSLNYLSEALESFKDKIKYPLIIPWASNIKLSEYCKTISEIFKDHKVHVLINEAKLSEFNIDKFRVTVDNLPENIWIGLDNCFIGNNILSFLSVIDFSIICLSGNIIRNLYLASDRIKIINGLKSFTDQLGIPILVRDLLQEEEYQLIKDLKLFNVTGKYLENQNIKND